MTCRQCRVKLCEEMSWAESASVPLSFHRPSEAAVRSFDLIRGSNVAPFNAPPIIRSPAHRIALHVLECAWHEGRRRISSNAPCCVATSACTSTFSSPEGKIAASPLSDCSEKHSEAGICSLATSSGCHSELIGTRQECGCHIPGYIMYKLSGCDGK
jgi:hypothetical protein